MRRRATAWWWLAGLLLAGAAVAEPSGAIRPSLGLHNVPEGRRIPYRQGPPLGQALRIDGVPPLKLSGGGPWVLLGAGFLFAWSSRESRPRR